VQQARSWQPTVRPLSPLDPAVSGWIANLRLALAVAFCLALTGCVVGPDFFPQPAPLANKFIGANSRAINSGHKEYWDWWKSFHDPMLDELVVIAYNQNLTLLSAGTKVLQARAVLGIAIGEFYPQVQQATGSLAFNRTSAATPIAPRNSKPQHFWTDALALQAAWELDFWGKFRRGVESADGAYLASIASYDDVLVSLLGDVAATYIGIRVTEKLLAVARSPDLMFASSNKLSASRRPSLSGVPLPNSTCSRQPTSSERHKLRLSS